MTTLVALATRECVVLGCDSLGSEVQRMIDPADLVDYFDPAPDYRLRLDSEGKPLLRSFGELYSLSKEVPVHHLTHMTKLFPLAPAKAGVMVTGVVSIGDRTVRSLVEEFSTTRVQPMTSGQHTVKDIADALTGYLWDAFAQQFPDENRRPSLELILGGYGPSEVIPQIYRIRLPQREIIKTFDDPPFGIVFGGQMKEIQRIVFGTDFGNRLKIMDRHVLLLRRYREIILDALKQQGVQADIPEPTSDELRKDLAFFSDNWDLDKFQAQWGDFSEQNAIECVDFFVDIMIKSQQFSTGMPTVGGEVHIALVTVRDGFRFISREEYSHKGHFLPKHRHEQ